MTTPNLALEPLVSAQAQKHVTVNEALARIDAATQLAVLDRDSATPPTTPADGDRYLIATSATEAWSGQDGKVALWDDSTGGWIFLAPRIGWRLWVVDEQILLVLTDTGWRPVNNISLNPVSDGLIGVNTTADLTNRLAVKSDAALFSHDDVTPGSGDMRLTLNKKQEASDASLTLQTQYSTRAQVGLTGTDNLTLKVSPDGSSFIDALSIDRYSGIISAPENPVFSAYTPAPWKEITTTHTRLLFTNAIQNIGGHYDTATSAFTAPTDGTYCFLINGFLSGLTDGRISFAINDITRTTQMQALKGAAPLSFTVVQPLKAGDYVTCVTGNVNKMFHYYQGHTMFSGWKIA